MNILEDILDGIFSSVIGGIVGLAGIVMWIFLIFFGDGIMDQAVVVGNLITTFILMVFWISTIVEWIIDLVKDKQQKKIKKIFTIIKIVIIITIFIGFFIYGYIHPYNNLVFHYSYTPIFSAIHTMWIPAIGLIFLQFILGKGKILEKIGGFFVMIGMWILIIIIAFFIGQIITGFLGFFWGIDETKSLYNNICYYEDLEMTLARTPQEMLDLANQALEEYKQDLKGQGKDSSGNNLVQLLYSDENFKNNYLSRYKLNWESCTRLENGNLIYVIKDRGREVTLILDAETGIFRFSQTENSK